MPISVTCPECEATYRVADEAAGKSIKCKKCGTLVSIPAQGGEAQAAGAKRRAGQQTDDESGSKSRTKKKSGAGKILIIVGGVVVLGCCLCTGAGVALPFIFPSLQFWKATKDAKGIVVRDTKDKDAFKDKD